MNVKAITRRGNASATAARHSIPEEKGLIRKTRLMSKSGVMLVRVEVFQDSVLRSMHLRLSTPVACETFTDMDRAFDAFRAMTQSPTGRAGLKNAA